MKADKHLSGLSSSFSFSFSFHILCIYLRKFVWQRYMLCKNSKSHGMDSTISFRSPSCRLPSFWSRLRILRLLTIPSSSHPQTPPLLTNNNFPHFFSTMEEPFEEILKNQLKYRLLKGIYSSSNISWITFPPLCWYDFSVHAAFKSSFVIETHSISFLCT